MVFTAATVELLLTCTSTDVPSDFVMWASYGALPSTLVSTRSTVPGTLASAAALTLDATSPVSACSVFPLAVCRPPLCCWAAVGVADAEDDVVAEEAALAIPAPPTAAAPTAATVTSLDRSVAMVFSLMDERDAINVAGRPARRHRGS